MVTSRGSMEATVPLRVLPYCRRWKRVVFPDPVGPRIRMLRPLGLLRATEMMTAGRVGDGGWDLERLRQASIHLEIRN